MKLRSTVKIARGQLIDVAPLVDVILLLLIFFMLTSSFVFQPGVKVDLPIGGTSGSVSTRYIIAVSSQDPPQIFFNDQLVTLEQLRTDLRKISRTELNAALILKADVHVPHGLVVDLLNMALAEGLSVIIATQPASSTATPPPPAPTP